MAQTPSNIPEHELMSVEIFRTNVREERIAGAILAELNMLYPDNRFNFDLEDCDKILRVKSRKITGADITAIANLLANNGFQCELLE